MGTLKNLNQAYGRLLYALGLLSGAACFLMMLLIVINVAGRYILNMPLPGAFEISESVLTVLVFCAFAITQHDDGHIRVDVLTTLMPPQLRRTVKSIMLLVGAMLFGLASYAAWSFAAESYAVNEQEWSAIQFPIWPVKFVVFGGLVLLAIQYLLHALIMFTSAVDETAQQNIVEDETWTS